MKHAGVTRLDMAVFLLALSTATGLYVLNVELAARADTHHTGVAQKVETSRGGRAQRCAEGPERDAQRADVRREPC